jgi:hypothetical protein
MKKNDYIRTYVNQQIKMFNCVKGSFCIPAFENTVKTVASEMYLTKKIDDVHYWMEKSLANGKITTDYDTLYDLVSTDDDKMMTKEEWAEMANKMGDPLGTLQP